MDDVFLATLHVWLHVLLRCTGYFLVSWGVRVNQKSHQLMLELNGLSPDNVAGMVP